MIFKTEGRPGDLKPRVGVVRSQSRGAVNVDAWWYAEGAGPLVVVEIRDESGEYLDTVQIQIQKRLRKEGQ